MSAEKSAASADPKFRSVNTPPRRFLGLAGLSLIGFGISVYQSQHFYQLRSGAAGFKSLCNLGESMNCDAVAASRFAELFAGIPISSAAAGWFLALFVVALIGRNAFWRREATRAALAMTAWSVICSVLLIIAMASVLKTWCLFCLIIDAINAASLALVVSLKPEGFAKHPADKAKWKSFAGIVAGGLALGIVGLMVLDSSKPNATEMRELVEGVMKTPPVAVGSGPEFPSLGPADAPVTIVEFSDFQCPYCRIGAMTLNSVLTLNPGKVRIVFRAFPLDPACNRKVQHSMHPVACESARAAICAHRSGKFEPVYEALFDKQSTLAPGRPAALARDSGMDPAQLATCEASDEVRAAVTRDIEEGIQLGVQSTPTFFINGRKVEGLFQTTAWSELISRLERLAKAK